MRRFAGTSITLQAFMVLWCAGGLNSRSWWMRRFASTSIMLQAFMVLCCAGGCTASAGDKALCCYIEIAGNAHGLMGAQGAAQRKLVDETLDKVDKLKPIAKRLDASLAQLAIAWCVKNEDVSTTILGASKLHQLEENLKALDVLPKLTAEVMEEIEAILNNKPDPVATYR